MQTEKIINGVRFTYDEENGWQRKSIETTNIGSREVFKPQEGIEYSFIFDGKQTEEIPEVDRETGKVTTKKRVRILVTDPLNETECFLWEKAAMRATFAGMKVGQLFFITFHGLKPMGDGARTVNEIEIRAPKESTGPSNDAA